MKTLFAAIVFTTVLAPAYLSKQTDQTHVNHADCLSKNDIIWYQNRSKSGIARTCTEQVLANNLSKGE
ncbi:hypothetical protein ACXJY6_07735 [Vibrio sp. RC27]